MDFTQTNYRKSLNYLKLLDLPDFVQTWHRLDMNFYSVDTDGQKKEVKVFETLQKPL